MKKGSLIIKPYTFLKNEGIRGIQSYFIKEKLEKGRFKEGCSTEAPFKEYIKKCTVASLLIKASDGIFVRENFKYLLAQDANEYRKIENGEVIKAPLIEVFDIKDIECIEKDVYSSETYINCEGKIYETKLTYYLQVRKWGFRLPKATFDSKCPFCGFERCNHPETLQSSKWRDMCNYLGHDQIGKKLRAQLLTNEKILEKWQSEQNPIRIKMALKNAFKEVEIWE